jgi:class 3 adenylate cyclase/tetratricopeptide (TPR) repeat protein
MEEKIDSLLPSAVPNDLAQLMSIWQAHDKTQWSQSPNNYQLLAEKILQRGEPLLAFDVVREGLSISPADIRLRQLEGLALARSGASERAKAILEELRGQGQVDEETLGMLGRTYKDLAAHAESPAQREQFLRRAAEIYAEAYRSTGGYWTGINAATMSLLCGETDLSRALAGKVREQCLKEVEDPSGDSYWELAALGEAALILHDLSQAEECYERAAKHAGRRWGDIHSSRRNARLILQHWNEDPAKIDKYLRVPSVIVFAGHMIDRPDRATPRFPGELEPAVDKELRKKIDMLKPGFGFTSAACGSDILFLEAMLDAGAEVSVVLPYEHEQFVRDSVDFIPNSSWRVRFDRVLERATRVVIASPQKLEVGGVAYEFCNQLLLGLATIRARQLDTAMIPLAVWDTISGDGPGGTATVVENWRSRGYKPEIVDLTEIRGMGFQPVNRQSALDHRQDADTTSAGDGAFRSRVVAILFADAVGFSKLNESEVPRFVQHFLGAIARLTQQFGDTIIAKNTWGDGLYFVFSDVDVAGKFALELANLVATTKWEEKGLRARLNLRIGLHAGPVYEFDDPITGTRSYSGTHVSRAARIEPITPAGQVYASEAFAALAAAQRTVSFACDYVGQTPMAKDYGTLPTYHVRHI